MENLIEKLKELGFSGNEAKVYLALIKKFPLTGYEISKMANIQQARAYDALKSLEAKQVVTVSDDKPASYTPIKPKELTKRYKRKITSTLDFLDKKLPSIKDTLSKPIVQLYGEKDVSEKIAEVIDNAKKELYILISSGDYKQYEQNIIDAYNRGVEIKIFGYDNFSASFGKIFAQSPLSVLDSKLSTRTVLVSSDNQEGVYGTIRPNPDSGLPELIWSKNKHVLQLIKSYIILSMYITDIESKFPEQLRYFYGTGMKKLRDNVLG